MTRDRRIIVISTWLRADEGLDSYRARRTGWFIRGIITAKH